MDSFGTFLKTLSKRKPTIELDRDEAFACLLLVRQALDDRYPASSKEWEDDMHRLKAKLANQLYK